MKEMVVISGKGGTGKTSLMGCFAVLAENCVLADCDVDAPDLHLLLSPSMEKCRQFIGGKIARIKTGHCIACGKCQEICRFDAVFFDGPGNGLFPKTFRIDPISCEGCGVCEKFCAENAILFEDTVSGEWYISDTRCGPMVHAMLHPGEGNSGKLVTLVRKEAKKIAEQNRTELILVDGSPGIGCPVMASLTGADLILVVTEPTLSGKSDMERVFELCQHFGIPTMVCINKYDINTQVAQEIETFCSSKNIPVVGRIRYDRSFNQAQSAGKSLVEYGKNGAAREVKTMWQRICNELGK